MVNDREWFHVLGLLWLISQSERDVEDGLLVDQETVFCDIENRLYGSNDLNRGFL